MVAELLAINIRASRDIKGIVVNNIEYKINQLADDTSLFLSDISSLKSAFKILDKFSIVSGLKMNKTKTEIISLGKNKHSDIRT